MKARVKQDRDQRRRIELPGLEEQLEVLWTFIASQPRAQLPATVRAMLERIEAVKLKYPRLPIVRR